MGGPYWFHKIIYAIFIFPVWLFCKLKFNLKTPKRPKVKGPCLVIGNHNTDFDMLFLGASFWKHMYFVGSEHIYRWGFVSKLIGLFFAPIARFKGSTDGASAMMILKNLRKGRNVCIFPEGNRSFNGLTTPVHPTIGKLAKRGKANLVIYRLEGGYFTSPRWATKLRKGEIRSVVAKVYTPEELSTMSADEICKAISDHIHEDAYAMQDARHIRYKGKNQAGGLETALYICPKCGGIQTMTGTGDTFTCAKCGLSARYTEYGYLEGENLPFTTVTQWDAWQSEKMETLVAAAGEAPLFSDDGVTLKRIDQDHNVEVAAEGAMSLSKTEFVVGEKRFPLEDIPVFTMFGRQNLIFTASGENYELRGSHLFSGRKYLRAFELLTGRPVTL